MACQRSQSCCNPSQKSALIPVTRARRRAVSGVTPRLPRTISFNRGNETPRRIAKADCDTPRGFRNSSSSISPGCVGGTCVGSGRATKEGPLGRRLVVVDDLDFVGISALPEKANPILFVNSNAILPGSLARRSLRRHYPAAVRAFRGRPLPFVPVSDDAHVRLAA
jgi:hypothetical protein